MVSNPGGVGLLGSVERCFELRGWHVVAVAMEPVLVEPVNPGKGLELELVDVVPHARRIGTSDALGLVEAIGRLGQGVIERVRDGPDRGAGPDLIEAFGKRTLVNWLPASEWVTSPISRRPPRLRRAISNASRTMSVRMWLATRQPTMRRLNASTMKHT